MPPDATIAPALGCTREEADQVLLALGWGRFDVDGTILYRRQRPPVLEDGRSRRRPSARRDVERSPFAVLKQLAAAK